MWVCSRECRCLCRPEVSATLELELQTAVGCLMWLLEEQQMLLTIELSLQPLFQPLTLRNQQHALILI